MLDTLNAIFAVRLQKSCVVIHNHHIMPAGMAAVILGVLVTSLPIMKAVLPRKGCVLTAFALSVISTPTI